MQVILGIVKALNVLGIEPDILTFGTPFDPEKIKQSYGQELQYQFRYILKHLPWKQVLLDYQVLFFNLLLHVYGKKYDLLVDSGNSQLFLPKKPSVISYIHFPSETLVRLKGLSLHMPDSQVSFRGIRKAAKWFIQPVYRTFSRYDPGRKIVCNSHFTEQAFIHIFPGAQNHTQVIYPPVELKQYQCPVGNREQAIVSLGRFAPDKGQLEQIRLAEKLPGMDFHFMGFVNNPTYFQRCQEYVNTRQLTNVYLHPNIPFNEMIGLMQSSRYFLHTMPNEHFGITAVQAIAAGCLPIVHDSGGQKETVPFDELRYPSLEQVPGIITQLENKNLQERRTMIEKLQQNARENFEADVFNCKFVELLEKVLLVDHKPA